MANSEYIYNIRDREDEKKARRLAKQNGKTALADEKDKVAMLKHLCFMKDEEFSTVLTQLEVKYRP